MPSSGPLGFLTSSTTEAFGRYLAQQRSSRLTDDMLDAMSYALSLTPQSRASFAPLDTQSLLKERPMNEIMEAMEAMITRVVREQIEEQAVLTRSGNYSRFLATWREAIYYNRDDSRALLTELMPAATPGQPLSNESFAAHLTNFIRTSPLAFNEIVKQATLDKPWFDEAIKAEVAEANPDLRVATLVHAAVVAEDLVTRRDMADIVDARMADAAVITKDDFDDLFEHALQDTDFGEIDGIDDNIRQVVGNMSFSTEVN